MESNFKSHLEDICFQTKTRCFPTFPFAGSSMFLPKNKLFHEIPSQSLSMAMSTTLLATCARKPFMILEVAHTLTQKKLVMGPTGVWGAHVVLTGQCRFCINTLKVITLGGTVAQGTCHSSAAQGRSGSCQDLGHLSEKKVIGPYGTQRVPITDLND